MTERELFQAVLDLPDAASRDAYLDAACAGDPDQRARIDALLHSHEMAGSFLGVPAAVLPEADEDDVNLTAASMAFGASASDDDGAKPRLDRNDELLNFLTPSARSDSLGRLGHYEVLQVLGRGGFGVVFRAFDDVLQRVVAVKMLAPHMAATSPARQRFLREARASAAVRHENVVQIYEVSEKPLPYLVMEFIPGETLQQRIDRSGPLDVRETLRIGRQIAEGLAAAHTNDLIHRDIKPGNVLLEGGTHRVKITDFGLARAADDASMTQSGMIAGTPLYMAPEQALGQSLDQRADLFSLGSVLYQMVTGRPPFRAANMLAVMKRVAEDTPRRVREIIPESPQWLSDIISKLHAKNPADRFASARDVADVLADCEAQLKANSRLRDFSLIPRGTTPRAPGRRKWPAVAAAAAVLLPLIVLAVLEMAGVTHVLGGRQAMPVAGGGAMPEKPAMPAMPAIAAAPAGEAWVPLFNGKDLTGWKTAPEQPGDWKVDGGILIGSAAQSNLFSDGTFGDFHLRAEAKINYGGDSGLFVRSPFALRPGRLPGQFRPAGGYEVEFQENPKYPRTGSVWDSETAGPPRVLQMTTGKPLPLNDEWCTLEIIARGKRVISMVNGVQTADCADPRTGYPPGRIVLQVYNPQTVVRFRKIEIRELPAAAPAMSEPPPPVAVAPFDAAQAKRHQEAWAKHLGVPVEYTNSIGMTLRLIPPGEYTMGTSPEEVAKAVQDLPEWAKANVQSEAPERRVRIPEPFYLATTEVTVGQFKRFVAATNFKTQAETSGKGGLAWTGEKHEERPEFTWRHPDLTQSDAQPVGQLCPADANAFCSWLEGLEGRTYRLPEEEQWEYACRAGTATPWSCGSDLEAHKLHGLVGWDLLFTGRAVAQKPANPFGLFDVHGNLAEMCRCRDGTYVNRGGSSGNDAALARSACRARMHRLETYALNGFRVAIVGDLRPAVNAASSPVAAVTSSAPLPPTFTNAVGMEFVVVPKGKSWLGGSKDRPGDQEVVIPADFYLGTYEVTQAEWEKVMGANPSHFSRNGQGKDAVKDVPDADLKRFPVEFVSWDQCQIFLSKLNERANEPGWVYRLPTAKEWEYACRGGPMADQSDSGFDFYFATPTNTLPLERANYDFVQGLKRTAKVGSYEPNPLGLHDMHGNVWEWFEDADKASGGSSNRVTGSGGWNHLSDECRASHRSASPASFWDGNLGLRLARVRSGAASPAAKSTPATVAPFTDADVRRIAALPAAEQVEAVREELMRRNPGFDGKTAHQVDDGVVMEIEVPTEKPTDVSPLRAFGALRMLKSYAVPLRGGLLADLSPLAGMNVASLTVLDLTNSTVGDAVMARFEGSTELKKLHLSGTNVTDAGLAHFKDRKELEAIALAHTAVTDAGLAHFQNCYDLKHLGLDSTQVGDAGLAHFKASTRLGSVQLGHTRVGDAGLAHLKGVPLRKVWIEQTRVTDLTPRQDMPLDEVRFTPKNIVKGLDVLREAQFEAMNGAVVESLPDPREPRQLEGPDQREAA